MYIAIDLKSFFASVECVERNLDPLTTNLVVADQSRTEKTICLAVTPSLKALGIPGRARLFEVVAKVKQANQRRLGDCNTMEFADYTYDTRRLQKETDCGIDYIVAPPQMATYMEYSTRIYQIYLRYVAEEDIHVYSIDEVFIDVTHYLNTYHMTAKELAGIMIQEVFQETGITATAGVGTNLYLAKIAMDIEAKHIQPDEDGVRIAELDEISYRRKLWDHKPLTDFWRIGRGYAKKLEQYGMHTMGDIARCSIGKDSDLKNEELLYRLFGVNAELLIDHAWGYEPCTIADIKAYRPEVQSLSSGQILQEPYPYERAELIVREMTDLLVYDLVEKQVVTDQVGLTIGYDIENLSRKEIRGTYSGEIVVDVYGRNVPKQAHGTIRLPEYTSSTQVMIEAMMNLFKEIVNPNLLVRRVTVEANHIIDEKEAKAQKRYQQLTLLDLMETETKEQTPDKEKSIDSRTMERERKMQETVIDIKKKFGKNALLKGMNLQEGAMTVKRNEQIGGHKA